MISAQTTNPAESSRGTDCAARLGSLLLCAMMSYFFFQTREDVHIFVHRSIDVLSNPQFLGTKGKRTIFAIKLTQRQGRDITKYSLVGSEAEVLLPPGCRFRVESVLPQGDLTIIQVEEFGRNVFYHMLVTKVMILITYHHPGRGAALDRVDHRSPPRRRC